MSEQEAHELSVISDLREHIFDLALENRIEFFYVPSLFDAGAWQDEWSGRRRMMIAPIRNVATYMGALHEIGHHAAGHTAIPAGTAAGRENRIDKEAEAWEWALDNSLLPATEEVWAEIRYALGSYLHVNNEHGVFGAPGDTFYRLSDRVGGVIPVSASRDDGRDAF